MTISDSSPLQYVASDLEDSRGFRLLELVPSIFKGGKSGHILYNHYGERGVSPLKHIRIGPFVLKLRQCIEAYLLFMYSILKI